MKLLFLSLFLTTALPLFQPTTIKMENGAKAYVQSFPFRTAVISWWAKQGSAGEEKRGATAALFHYIAQDEALQSWAGRGAELQVEISQDYAHLMLTLPAKNAQQGVTDLIQAVSAPTFSEKRWIFFLYNRFEDILQSQKPQSAKEEGYELLREYFYRDHPYAFSPYPDIDSDSTLSLQDIQKRFQQIITPQQTVITVTGGIQQERIEKIVSIFLESWHPETLPLAQLPRIQLEPLPKIVLRKKQSQAEFFYAFLAPPAEDENAVVAADVLYAWFNLPDNSFRKAFRQHSIPLSYFEAHYLTQRLPGMFIVSFAVPERKAEAAEALFQKEVQHLQSRLSQKEIRKGAHYLLRLLAEETETNRDINTHLGFYLTLGKISFLKGYERKVRNMSRWQMEQLFKKYFQHRQEVALVFRGLAHHD